jgi:hypothetical protein
MAKIRWQIMKQMSTVDPRNHLIVHQKFKLYWYLSPNIFAAAVKPPCFFAIHRLVDL